MTRGTVFYETESKSKRSESRLRTTVRDRHRRGKVSGPPADESRGASIKRGRDCGMPEVVSVFQVKVE